MHKDLGLGTMALASKVQALALRAEALVLALTTSIGKIFSRHPKGQRAMNISVSKVLSQL